MGPAELVDHLESTHHRYLHSELPRLDTLAEKVASVHGERHPELLDVLADVKDLRDDLEPHLMKEERVLFPMIRELCAAEGPVSFQCGSLRNPISMMMLEHDRAGALLEQLRDRTEDYTAPADACASYRALYQGSPSSSPTPTSTSTRRTTCCSPRWSSWSPATTRSDRLVPPVAGAITAASEGIRYDRTAARAGRFSRRPVPPLSCVLRSPLIGSFWAAQFVSGTQLAFDACTPAQGGAASAEPQFGPSSGEGAAAA